MLRTLAALFDTKREAQDAEAGLARRGIESGRVTLVQDAARGLTVPAEDRATYEEGLRRGGVLLLARVEDAEVEAVIVVLEQTGAVDLDARERDWRAQGWTREAATPATAAGTALADAAPGAVSTHAPAPAVTPPPAGTGVQEQAIPVFEERLVVGKRDVTRGTVRVRVHVREVPVEVPVHLREEHAVIERHVVDRPVTDADTDAFQEKVVAVDTVVEEPVVAKEAVVVEEIVVHKDVALRVAARPGRAQRGAAGVAARRRRAPPHLILPLRRPARCGTGRERPSRDRPHFQASATSVQCVAARTSHTPSSVAPIVHVLLSNASMTNSQPGKPAASTVAASIGMSGGLPTMRQSHVCSNPADKATSSSQVAR